MGLLAFRFAVTSSSRRLALAVAVVCAAGWVIVACARWIERSAPDPSSDLDVPRVFHPQSDQSYDVLARTPAGGVPILSYHYFREGLTPERVLRVLGAVLLSMPTLPDRDYWTTSVPEFDREMRWLHDRGYRTITCDELADWLDGKAPRPERAVVLTIDDGDESFVRLAVPVLRRYGFKATVFFLTGLAGARDWNELNLVGWDTLRKLEAEGVIRVESHTHNLHTKVRRNGEAVPLFLVSYRDAAGRPSSASPLVRDLRASRDAIRRELGHDTSFLAWPFGFGEAPVDSLAYAEGFRRILTLSPRRNRRDYRAAWEEPPTASLGRYAITARTSFRIFRLMVEGAPATHPARS
ncbi:MAG: polysaccharide deacetylase family protein [bacterium]